MKTKLLTRILFALSCLFILVGCSAGLDPARYGDGNTALISLRLSSTGSVNRAIAGGDSILYIKTISGSSGKLFGPYKIASGGKFETDDISPGKYTGFHIFLSPNALSSAITDSLRKDGDAYTSFISGSGGVPSPFAELADGMVSASFGGAFTIEPGVVNSISATLIPQTGTNTTVSLASAAIEIAMPASVSARRVFLRLADLPEGSIALTCAANTAEGTVGGVTLFDTSGKAVAGLTENAENPKAPVYTLENPVASGYFLYLEYTATDLTLTLQTKAEPTEPAASYVVTFDSDNPTTAATPATKTVTAPATTIDALPAAPVKTGFIFSGWWTGKDGAGTEFTASTAVSANLTVYAKWTAIVTYTVTFDGDNATTAATPATKTVTAPATTIDALPAAPVKTGFIFSGWWTGKDGAGTEFTASTAVSANLTVYAKWVIPATTVSVTVSFVNDGTPIFTVVNDMGPEITLPITFTATSGFNTYRWYVNGVLVTDAYNPASTSFEDHVLSVTSDGFLNAGPNSVMLMIETVDGEWYSSDDFGFYLNW